LRKPALQRPLRRTLGLRPKVLPREWPVVIRSTRRRRGEANDSYISDPAKPVLYRPRPIESTYYPKGSGWSTWLVDDQRFVQGRPDILSWETEPLDQDLGVAGDITGKLFASTTGKDADFVVKLIDVYPEDYPADQARRL
jgi:uncharacterized protein